MGGEIDRKVFTVYKGVKIYFCCPGCDKTFLKEPAKYIPKLPAAIQEKLKGSREGKGDTGHD